MRFFYTIIVLVILTGFQIDKNEPVPIKTSSVV